MLLLTSVVYWNGASIRTGTMFIAVRISIISLSCVKSWSSQLSEFHRSVAETHYENPLSSYRKSRLIPIECPIRASLIPHRTVRQPRNELIHPASLLYQLVVNCVGKKPTPKVFP